MHLRDWHDLWRQNYDCNGGGRRGGHSLSEQLQLEERVPEKELQLLVPWSSPWPEFRTAIGPAFARSPRPLAGEARSGLFPFRNMPLVCLAEFLLLAVWVVLPGKLAQMRPKLPPAPPKYDVLYFSADELPRTEDNGGSSAGDMGRAGGLHAYHRTQAIRVVRGDVLREKVLDAPKLNLPHSEAAVANLFAYKAQLPGPAPTEGLVSARKMPSLSSNAVAPAPQNTVHRDTLLTAPRLDASVVPPAPNQVQTDALSMRLPGSQRVQVIPPPVSAPERATTATSRLTLPAPSVVVPAPTQIMRDLAKSGPGYGPGELHPQVVPPTVQVNGTQDRRTISGLGNASVVPPPVDAEGPLSAHKLAEWNNAAPVAPTVKATNGSLAHQPLAGLGVAVVPPPPSVSPASSLGTGGKSTRANGLGAALDTGSVLAPPASSSKANATGVVVSTQPGDTQAVPTKAGTGALALSPTGGAKPGIGGSRGGTGIDFGTGSGAGPVGTSPGAATSGTGHAADLVAKSGISPYPGKGGAGSGNVANPPMPGVSVHGGGNNIITLPSFNTNGVPPSSPVHPRAPGDLGAGLTVIATSRSGGAFDLYGKLPGQNYTIYLPTTLGTAVMQFADPTSSQRTYTDALTSPRPLRTNLPTKLTPARLILSCTLDRTGSFGNLRVLEPAGAEMTAKVVAALRNWKFSPAMRGNEPVEVNVLLGFDIDTR